MKNKKRSSRKKYRNIDFLDVSFVVLVLVSAFAMGSAPEDWKIATYETLNLSDSMSATAEGLVTMSSPLIQVVEDVNTFYQMAATEMMTLLDMSDTQGEIQFFMSGVNEFYRLASLEMEELLDFSDTQAWPGKVAGMRVESCN